MRPVMSPHSGPSPEDTVSSGEGAQHTREAAISPEICCWSSYLASSLSAQGASPARPASHPLQSLRVSARGDRRVSRPW